MMSAAEAWDITQHAYQGGLSHDGRLQLMEIEALIRGYALNGRSVLRYQVNGGPDIDATQYILFRDGYDVVREGQTNVLRIKWGENDDIK